MKSLMEVIDVLDWLPDGYRRVLELHFLHGFSVEETARELGLTPGNVKVIQYRALAKAVQVGKELL
jgi:RNA polymerase sigma-70 factor (ECF subfamily)